METKSESLEKPPENDEQRESGMPGGGKGRRDEVGRSGVYPVSGPHPPSGDAPLHGMASWGQGERGAAGYEDHGDSEITNFERWVSGEGAPADQEPTGEEGLNPNNKPAK
jgi:hypothetical protein